MKTLIQTLAEYTVDLRWDDLPLSTVERAKQVILDACGNLLCSRFDATAEQVFRYAQETGGAIDNTQAVRLTGDTDLPLTADAALFAYAAVGRMADMDDGYTHAMGHPGSFLIPTLLVAANQIPVSGKLAIAAVVAAYDVYARIAEAVNPYMHRQRGFDATGVCGPIAAAALLAKLEGLDAEHTAHAMGLAASFSGGLIECQNDGTSGKFLCGAWAAMNGLRAVRLAKVGFTGPSQALEGKSGLFQGFQGNTGYDDSHVLENLGSEFKIHRVYFKRYACLRGVHATMDAILRLKEEHGLTANSVQQIDIRASSFLLRLSRPNPKTVVSAQGSLQFTAAVILRYGRLDSEAFLRKCMTDPDISDTASKITVTPDAEMQQYLEEHPTHFGASRVVVRTTAGNILQATQLLPEGEAPGTEFGWPMLEKKFIHLIRNTPFAPRSEAYLQSIRSLEQKNSVGKLLYQGALK